MNQNLIKVKIGDGYISYYLKDNQARWTIILVHGFYSSSDFASSIYDLPNNFNIISVNLPGSKYVSNGQAELGIDYFSNLLDTFITDHVKSRKIVLVGHSLGGGVVAKVSQNKKVKQVIYVATINPRMIESKSWIALYDFFYPQGLKKNMKKLIMKAGSSLYTRWVDKDSAIKAFLDAQGKFLPVIKNYLLNLEYMSDILRHQYEQSLIKKPLFIIGSEDKTVEAKYFIEFVKEDLNQVVWIIEGTKHNPFKENGLAMNNYFNNHIPFKRRWFRKVIVKHKNFESKLND